jgi:hypothetical protein
MRRKIREGKLLKPSRKMWGRINKMNSVGKYSGVAKEYIVGDCGTPHWW